ncbi:hypothetical protein [Azorhizobium doebereinerae]|uniref:hypothetical protein n=1 Tax=Azorhizobium doebereinerae TaxID=281091 RepID=UPI0003FC2FD9|nr:hypothetical protein [Azorhizobium doebereinerae]
MYDPSDPRASLAPPKPGSARNQPAFPATYARFYQSEPQERRPGADTWIVRGQTFVVLYSAAEGRQVFERTGQGDEYVLLIPDAETRAVVEVDGTATDIAGFSVTFVPPGDSRIILPEGGRIVRLFTAAAGDLIAQASNAATYAAPNLAIPELKPWPAPHEGYRVRSYSLAVPPEPGRFGRIFRGSTFMVNYLEPKDGPRDPAVLSPHHHDDFEQCSLALSGEYVHHLRWPWTTNLAHWRGDEHEHCASPSVAIIPPPAIHTSQAIGAGINQLVDIFCPPRADFSAKPGWVLNAADYPLPADGGDAGGNG